MGRVGMVAYDSPSQNHPFPFSITDSRQCPQHEVNTDEGENNVDDQCNGAETEQCPEEAQALPDDVASESDKHAVPAVRIVLCTIAWIE